MAIRCLPTAKRTRELTGFQKWREEGGREIPPDGGKRFGPTGSSVAARSTPLRLRWLKPNLVSSIDSLHCHFSMARINRHELDAH